MVSKETGSNKTRICPLIVMYAIHVLPSHICLYARNSFLLKAFFELFTFLQDATRKSRQESTAQTGHTIAITRSRMRKTPLNTPSQNGHERSRKRPCPFPQNPGTSRRGFPRQMLSDPTSRNENQETPSADRRRDLPSALSSSRTRLLFDPREAFGVRSHSIRIRFLARPDTFAARLGISYLLVEEQLRMFNDQNQSGSVFYTEYVRYLYRSMATRAPCP